MGMRMSILQGGMLFLPFNLEWSPEDHRVMVKVTRTISKSQKLFPICVQICPNTRQDKVFINQQIHTGQVGKSHEHKDKQSMYKIILILIDK